MSDFKARYGPWAWSPGPRRVWVRRLLPPWRPGPQSCAGGPARATAQELAAQLTEQHAIQVEPLAADLADMDVCRTLIASLGQDVGLLVCNAAYSAVGRFQDVGADALQQILAVNTAAPWPSPGA